MEHVATSMGGGKKTIGNSKRKAILVERFHSPSPSKRREGSA